MKTFKVLLVPMFLLSLFFMSCEKILDDEGEQVETIMYKGLEHKGDGSTDLLLSNGKLEVSTKSDKEGVLGIDLQGEKSLNMYMEPVDLNTEGKMEVFYASSETDKDNPILGIAIERTPNGEIIIKGFSANSENVRIEAYKDGQLVYRNDEFEGRWLWLRIAIVVYTHASIHNNTDDDAYKLGLDWKKKGIAPDTGIGGIDDEGIRIELEDYSIEIDMIQIVSPKEEDTASNDSAPYLEIKTQNIDKYTIIDEDVEPLAFLPTWGILFGQPDFIGQCSGPGVCGLINYPYPHLPIDFDVNEAKLIGTSQPAEDKIELEFDATHFSQEKIQEVFGEEYFLMQEPAILGNELVKHLNKKYGNLIDTDEITLPVGEYEIERFYTENGELQSCVFPYPIFTPWGILIIEVRVIFIKY